MRSELKGEGGHETWISVIKNSTKNLERDGGWKNKFIN